MAFVLSCNYEDSVETFSFIVVTFSVIYLEDALYKSKIVSKFNKAIDNFNNLNTLNVTIVTKQQIRDNGTIYAAALCYTV